MQLIKNILQTLLVFALASNCIAQQKDTVSKKENTGLFKHMKVLNQALPDTDKDGITDQFDKEQNTAKGCPVDMHGVSLDTDKDGVVDCKDKEPLTSRDCFPVDTTGVGKCLERPCCGQGLVDPIFYPDSCELKQFQSLYFKENGINADPVYQKILESIALQLSRHPGCNLTIFGYYKKGENNSKGINEKRIKAIIKYLVDHEGISESRLFQNILEGSKVNMIEFHPKKAESYNQ